MLWVVFSPLCIVAAVCKHSTLEVGHVSFSDNGFLCWLNKDAVGCKHSIAKKCCLLLKGLSHGKAGVPGQTHLICFTWRRESKRQLSSLSIRGASPDSLRALLKVISFKTRLEKRMKVQPDGNVFWKLSQMYSGNCHNNWQWQYFPSFHHLSSSV